MPLLTEFPSADKLTDLPPQKDSMFSRLTLRPALVAAILPIAVACVDQSLMPKSETASRTTPHFSSVVGPTDRLVVAFKAKEPATFQKAVEKLGGQVVRRQKDINLAEVSGLTDQAAVSLRKTTGVASVDRDMDVQWIPASPSLQLATGYGAGPGAQGTDQSSAGFFPIQWNMQVTQADQAWGVSNAGQGRLVCVLDTGIDPDHPDINGRVAVALSVISAPLFPGDLEPLDYNAHGTLSAGFITSNGIGVASVAPDASLCSIKVLKVTGSGSFGDVIAGIVTATQLGASVINMSLGAYIDRTLPGVEGLRAALRLAVRFANDKGVTVVASAGNNASNLNEDGNLIVLPGETPGVISVGATAPFQLQNFDMIASYSNFGSSGVDMFAPGGDFLPGGNQFDLVVGPCSRYQLTLPFACGTFDYLLAAGTSEAAPMVTGAAAVVQSQTTGKVSPAKVEACLRNNTDIIGPSSVFGSGRLNVLKASQCSL